MTRQIFPFVPASLRGSFEDATRVAWFHYWTALLSAATSWHCAVHMRSHNCGIRTLELPASAPSAPAMWPRRIHHTLARPADARPKLHPCHLAADPCLRSRSRARHRRCGSSSVPRPLHLVPHVLHRQAHRPPPALPPPPGPRHNDTGVTCSGARVGRRVCRQIASFVTSGPERPPSAL